MNSLSLISSQRLINIQQVKLAGKFYGYPQCCINSFMAHYTGKYHRTSSQLLVHNGCGFIPCHDCATKIIMGETTLEQLITDRICSTNFSSPTIPLSKNPEWISYTHLMYDVVIPL
jgi:hypothetical protein